MKVLLAVDGSEYTKQMLDYLAAHPGLFDASTEFTALSVCAPITPGALTLLPKDFISDYYADNAREVLEPVQAFARERGWALKADGRVGVAADVIADLAESGQFDLLVMGSHGRSGLARVVIGSVVSQVMARSKVALLIVRH